MGQRAKSSRRIMARGQVAPRAVCRTGQAVDRSL